MNRNEIRKKDPMKSINASTINASRSNHSFASSRIRGIRPGSRSNLFASTSRKNVIIDSSKQGETRVHSKPTVQVFDDMGQDVTPRPLLQLDPAVVKKNQSSTLFGTESIATVTPSEAATQSFYLASSMSMFGGFSSFKQQSLPHRFGSTVSGRSSPESVSEDIAEPSTYPDKFSSGLGEIQTRHPVVKEELTEKDLDKMVNVMLSETETFWILDLPGTSVPQDGENADEVREKNQKYEELIKLKQGNDSYVDRGMQTFNDDRKHKEVQVTKVETFDTGCLATTWDIYDTYCSEKIENAGESDDDDNRFESLSRPVSGRKTGGSNLDETESVSTGSVRPSSEASESVSGASVFTLKSQSFEEDAELKEKEAQDKSSEEIAAMKAEQILKSENMQKDLFVMERMLNLNTYQPKQAQYRGLDVVKDIDDERKEDVMTSTAVSLAQLGPNLNKLWSYTCALTKGRNVSCLAWNKRNPDILAVGYGEFNYSEQKGGLACCWSIKNPEYPERVYHVPHGVTAVDFSAAHPSLLAVGMYNGSIKIYNVRKAIDVAALDSRESQGKHTAPVWQVRWVDRNQGTAEEHDEILISISADGRVTKWSIRKGFECADLMKLKRVSVSKQTKGGGKDYASKKGDALISRFAAGFCFDVLPSDSNIYLAGTEEGTIHKCSCSYNEQFLETYYGHTGPVYKVKWSPFVSDAFLTCSADWSIRLWHQERSVPAMTFLSSTKSVSDVSWSPLSATLFACVNDRAVEIWDLKVNTLDPIISFVPVQDVRLSAVKFALDSELQTILVGDSEGQVTVYQLRGIDSGSELQVRILEKLLNMGSRRTGNSKRSDQADHHEDVFDD